MDIKHWKLYNQSTIQLHFYRTSKQNILAYIGFLNIRHVHAGW